jgi:hypothetical protein
MLNNIIQTLLKLQYGLAGDTKSFITLIEIVIKEGLNFRIRKGCNERRLKGRL